MSETENPNPEKWWRHRRWAHWYGVIGATFSAVLYVILLVSGIVDPQTSQAAQPVVQTSIWAHLSLAIVYHVGASGVDGIAKLRGK